MGGVRRLRPGIFWISNRGGDRPRERERSGRSFPPKGPLAHRGTSRRWIVDYSDTKAH
jgi:hypothetical protein